MMRNAVRGSVFHGIIPLVCAGLIVFLCIFKVGNTDFWWHVAAGRLMLHSGWITTDPFAYTRIGELYLANHEWLSQIIFALVFDASGAVGITILRVLLVFGIFGIPLLIGPRKYLLITPMLAVLAAVGARPSLTDRPQLFTFLCFSLTVTLCTLYLESPLRIRKKILIVLPLIIVLWSNLHGAAVMIGIAVIGALLTQRILAGGTGDRRWLAISLVAAGIATMVTPAGFGNIRYLINLLTDDSASMIAEWQPARMSVYFVHTLPLWIAALITLWFGRRHRTFCILLLVGTGILSRMAGRHETLFLIAALAVCVYQIGFGKGWSLISNRVKSLPHTVHILCILCIFFILCILTYVRSYDINRNDNLFGIGLFEPANGAAEFLRREAIAGNIFNNYNIGGELLYEGFPVFIDGRNIDYGAAYMSRAIEAGVDPAIWKQLQDQYHFSIAVIYYDLQSEMHPIPYTDLLDADPDWTLTYLDDWVAVYVDEETEAIEGIDGITTVTPATLTRQEIPEQMGLSTFRTMEAELQRMIQYRPDGVKARLYLAKLYTAISEYDLAEIILKEAKLAQPQNYLVDIGFMKLRMEQGQWDEALQWLKRAKRHAGFTGVRINRDLEKKIRQQAGQ